MSVGATSPICPPPNLFKDTNGAARPLPKPQSNVEKITAMLVSQNLMGSRPTTTNGHANTTPQHVPSNQSTTSSLSSTSSSNRVTININQTTSSNGSASHRQKDSSAPINGILKNGTSTSLSTNGHHSSHSSSTVSTPNGEPRNISFGNM